MTVPADGDNVIQMPHRPSAADTTGQAPPAPKAQSAQRARARTWKPPVREVTTVLNGASLLDKPAPAIMTIWAMHSAAASYYEGWAVKWFRYGYGAWHAFTLVPLLRTIEYVTDSPPKLLAASTVLLVVLFLLHVI